MDRGEHTVAIPLLISAIMHISSPVAVTSLFELCLYRWPLDISHIPENQHLPRHSEQATHASDALGLGFGSALVYAACVQKDQLLRIGAEYSGRLLMSKHGRKKNSMYTCVYGSLFHRATEWEQANM